ncbi:hypothetical protein DNI29_11505 [Hymenobacter sediminis]|uniref:hypothetical protein n=1 Tax=Hymenobacter sediminis TaxID=2218621 RepID=UPI000DA6C372|nr:hypothetical protein [Hymenobacter sediminis]RPD46784.1 hypothetical protein DNI29_11505 [Hymenobacter sediminis]
MADTVLDYAWLTGAAPLYGPEEFRAFILKYIQEDPELSAIMVIEDGIKADMDVVFVGDFEKVTHLDPGCGAQPSRVRIPFEKLKWQPKAMLAWIAECARDLDGTFMAWGMDVGYKRDDLQNALIKIKSGRLVPGDADTERTVNYWNEFVQDKFISAIKRDIYRFVLLGDTTISAAKLTHGADDVKNYNAIDGVFKQLFNAGEENRAYTIAANQSADQELPAGESYKIFKALHNAAEGELEDATDLIYLCTSSVAKNWQDYRESNDKVQVSWELQEGRLVAPTFRDVPIIKVKDLDKILKRDFKIAGKIDLPHRVVLTTRRNLRAGFDSYNAATQVDAWYDRKDRETNMRAEFMMDAKVMSSDLILGAY